MLFQRYAIKNKKIMRMFLAINQKRSLEYKDWVADMIHSYDFRKVVDKIIVRKAKYNPFNTNFTTPNEKKIPALYRDSAINKSLSKVDYIRKFQREHTNYIYNILIKSSELMPEVYRNFKTVFDHAFKDLVNEANLEIFDGYLDNLEFYFNEMLDKVLSDKKMFNTAMPIILDGLVDKAIFETSELNTALEIKEQENDFYKPDISEAIENEIIEANYEAFVAHRTIPNVSLDKAPLETLRRNIQSEMSMFPDQYNESKRMIKLYSRIASDSKPALENEKLAGIKDVKKAIEHHSVQIDNQKIADISENKDYSNTQTYNLEREVKTPHKPDFDPDKITQKQNLQKYSKKLIKKVD